MMAKIIRVPIQDLLILQMEKNYNSNRISQKEGFAMTMVPA